MLLGSILLAAQAASAEQKIVVVFRYDDYSSTSHTDIEVRTIEAFRSRGLSLTVAVMPFTDYEQAGNVRNENGAPLSASKAGILKSAIEDGAVDVALHGFSHEAISRWSGLTEFKGLDYTSQALRIEKGKNRLEDALGIEVTAFIPPFNSFDETTLRALETLGFTTLSAHLDEEGYGSVTSRLRFIPATAGVDNLRVVVESARTLPDPQPVIVVLFHPYDFLEVDKALGSFALQELIDLLDWLTDQEDVDVMSMSQARIVVDDLSARRFAEFTDRFVLRLVPPILQKRYHFPVGVYYFDLHWIVKAKILISLLLFYGTIALPAAIAAFFVGGVPLSSRSRLFAWTFVGLGPCLFVLFLLYDLRNLVVRYQGATVLAVLFGASIGALCALMQTGRPLVPVSEDALQVDTNRLTVDSRPFP
jgi:hypothetical protein